MCRPTRARRASFFIAASLAVSLRCFAADAPAGKVLLPQQATPYVPVVETIDADQTFDAQTELQSDLPSQFNGLNINNFLGANRFYSAGITGQGAIVANVEGGQIWGGPSGHETLTQVTNYTTGTGAINEADRHATWVGMTIAGRNGGTNQGTFQTGIAPGADLRSGGIATSWTAGSTPGNPRHNAGFTDTPTSCFTAYKPLFGTADVINSSWGYTDAAGALSTTKGLDGLAKASPQTTFVVAAGNSGPGANTVAGPASGYNNISVGAYGNANAYDTVASFSSRGPQSYSDPVHGTIGSARAPIDISAPGMDLVSAYYGGQTGGNRPQIGGSADGPAGGPNFYSSGLAGTSFAAPIVAGAATLLDSASYNTPTVTSDVNSRDARVIKAVLLNSATKTPGWNNGQSLVGGVIQTSQSLDYAVGAGLVNLNAAYDQYLGGTTDLAGTGGGAVAAEGWDYGTVSPGGHTDYAITPALVGGTTLTATLDWFRDRTYVSTISTTDNAFRDLDLQIWDSTFTTLIAQSNSTYNDVEHLSFTLPATGSYGIRAVYTQTVFGAAATETFGLAWAATPVPEPAMAVLPVMGALMLLRRGRRRGLPLPVAFKS